MSEEKISNNRWFSVFFTIKDALVQYIQEGAFFHGAALAYYTLFAFIPIVYLTTSIFGRFFGQKNIAICQQIPGQGQLMAMAINLMGIGKVQFFS